MRSSTWIILFIITLLLLSACQGAENGTSLDPTDTAKPKQTASPLPSATATQRLPTETNTPLPSPTITATPTLTPTPTMTPFLGFEDAYVYEAFATPYKSVFYFVVPGVSADYFGTVDGVAMTCEFEEDQPNALTCRSPENLYGSDVKSFTFYADEAMTVLVYAGDFATGLNRAAPTAAPLGIIYPRADFGPEDITWAQKPADCPERGINLQCEIEYRLYSDGDCLVGMSCVDSCGYYYSIDTIKGREGDWVGWGPCW